VRQGYCFGLQELDDQFWLEFLASDDLMGILYRLPALEWEIKILVF